MIFKYSVNNSEQIFEYDLEIPHEYIDPYNYEDVIKEVANDYYCDHDGYEDKWPLTFKLFDDKNNFLHESKINVECVPTYYTVFKKEE